MVKKESWKTKFSTSPGGLLSGTPDMGGMVEVTHEYLAQARNGSEKIRRKVLLKGTSNRARTILLLSLINRLFSLLDFAPRRPALWLYCSHEIKLGPVNENCWESHFCSV